MAIFITKQMETILRAIIECKNDPLIPALMLSLDLPHDNIVEVIETLYPVQLLNLDNGDLTTIESTADILVLNIKNIERLKGTTPFAGHLLIDESDNLQEIEDDFMLSSNVKSIRFIGNCSSLKKIGKRFMAYSSLLSEIDCSNWISVTNIDDAFLYVCDKITRVDCSKWTAIEHIGHHFIRDCKSLCDVICSNWTNLKTVGNGFLEEDTQLKLAKCSNWSAVEQIGANFMFNCDFACLNTSGWGRPRIAANFRGSF